MIMAQLLMAGVFWFVSITGGEVVIQKMGYFPLATWENGDQLFWKGAKIGDRMELATEVDAEGTYRLQVVLTKAPDYGMVQFELDGKKVGGQIDLYSTWVGTTPPIPLGDLSLQKGKHTLTVTIVGKNEKSTGTLFGIDQVLLTKKLPPVLPPALLQNESDQFDELSDLSLLPKIRSDERSIMFSSYDRTGENNDGFSGNYSKLWVEDGNSVLAVMEGPGVVERIWFTHSLHKRPGLLDLQGEHIRIYLDGNEKPAVDIPLEDLFRGQLPQFPSPLVGENQGGYYCYVPIPYRDECKIEVDGTAVKFYQITYTKLPTANRLGTFSMEMASRPKLSLSRAVRLWSNLGEPAALELKNAEWTEVDLAIEPDQMQKIDLPVGHRMVRAVLFEGNKEQLDAVRNAQLQFSWDAQQKPAVDLSGEFFFCQALGKTNYRSLLTGSNDRGWYNFMPMPYRESASVTVHAVGKPVSGKLRVATVPVPTDVDMKKLGYLHSAYEENLPTQSEVYHTFLKQEGTGHYIGTYLVTSGETDQKLPFWLEGDESFTVDGNLDIHGTGSEDYFNCGWYAVEGRLNGPGGAPVHGFPVYRLQDDRYNMATAYRWHLADPVPFETQIDAKIEHGPDNRQKADYRSAAFYYKTTP